MESLRLRPGATVRALEGRRLEVLAAPYGSPEDRDHLNEYFSARTDFMLDIGDRRPALYFHGFTSEKKMAKKPSAIGIATAARTDEQGLWMEVTLKDSPLADKLYKAAEAGTCKASTGAVNYLCRTAQDGEVEVWPIGELSLIDEGPGRHPANDKAIAVPLKALFAEMELDVPEAFGEDAEQPANTQGATKMADEEIVVKDEPEAPEPVPAVKAAEEPKRKALFNVKKETVGEPADNAKKESWEWFWGLRHGNTTGPAFRVLEETEAAEGLPMVPQDALAQIIALRDAADLAARIGITTYQTNRLIFNVPRESTAMTALAAIAEEGAYVANEPAFALLPLTVVKYGSMITATEELLEDQNLFIPWFTNACARAWALARNTALFAEVKTSGTQAVHSATFAEADIFGWIFAMADPWRAGCKLVMDPTTMAVLRAALVATHRAYGDFPEFGGDVYPSFMGYPVFLDTNWEAIGGGDLFLVASMINPQAMCVVENGSLSIKVDPYGDSLNGRIRYFPRARFVFGTTQPVGVQNISDHA